MIITAHILILLENIRLHSENDLVQLRWQGLDPGEEGAAEAEGARDEAGLKVHGAEEGRQMVI